MDDIKGYVVIPIRSLDDLNDIPSDIREAAQKSVDMWKSYMDELYKQRIEETRQNIEQLKLELEKAQMRDTLGRMM